MNPGAGSTRDLASRLEYTTPGEQFFNYCLWPYTPVASPEGKFSPANLLYHTFELAGLDERAYEMVERIRQAIGVSRTVWGVKLLGDTLAWEYYFYDYRRRKRERSISRVLEAIRPMIRCGVQPNEALHYFMFSLDVTGAMLTGEREMEQVHMYLGNVGSTVSSGVSYALTKNERRLENYYFFFRPAEGLDEIIGKVACSAFIDPEEVDLSEIIWPELVECDTICVANKRHNDCIYFSGVNVDQFLFFLERLRYPAAIIGFVKEYRAQLDHLLFDVGFDYTFGADGLRVVKSGYYGTF